jgi:hypothetical protein
MNNGKVDFATEVAALKFSEGKPDIWEKKKSMLREVHFWRSIFIISFYGVGNAIVQALYRTHHITLPIKEAFFAVFFLCTIIGGVYVTGGLNKRRVSMSIFAMLIYAIHKFVVYKYFHDIFAYLEIFQFIPGCWLFIWWIVSEPELMNRLGLRKTNLVRDFLQTLILLSFIAIYVGHLLAIYGFKLKFHPVDMTAYFIGSFINMMFVNTYCFGVWNLLKKRGMNIFQSILALLVLIIMMQAPVIMVFAFMNLVNPIMALSGFIGNTMLTLIVMHFSFTHLRNSLTSTFLMAMIMLLLRMAGVV